MRARVRRRLSAEFRCADARLVTSLRRLHHDHRSGDEELFGSALHHRLKGRRVNGLERGRTWRCTGDRGGL